MHADNQRAYIDLVQRKSALGAGDTLCLRAGVYNQRVSFSTAIVVSYPGENAIIDGTGIGLGTTQDLVDVTGAGALMNVEVRNSTARGVRLVGNGAKAIGNRVHDVQYNAILAGGSNNLIDGNEVWNAVLSNTNGALGSGGWASAINTWRASDVIIQNNYVHDSWGEGICLIQTNGGLVDNNRVDDTWSVLIYLDGDTNIAVSDNRASTTSTEYDRSGRPAIGVLVASEGGDPVSNISITNNLLSRTSGISTWNIAPANLVISGNLES